MRRFAVPFVVLFLAACASGRATGERPSGIAQPDIEVKIAGNVFFGSTSEAPSTFEAFILNRAAEGGAEGSAEGVAAGPPVPSPDGRRADGQQTDGSPGTR